MIINNNFKNQIKYCYTNNNIINNGNNQTDISKTDSNKQNLAVFIRPYINFCANQNATKDFLDEIKDKLDNGNVYIGKKKEKAEELLKYLNKNQNKEKLSQFIETSSKMLKSKFINEEAKAEAKLYFSDIDQAHLYHGTDSEEDYLNFKKTGLNLKKLGEDSFGGFSLAFDEGLSKVYSFDHKTALEFEPHINNGAR